MKVIRLKRRYIRSPNFKAKKGYLRLYGPLIKAVEEMEPNEMLEVEHGKGIQVNWIKKILKERFPNHIFQTIIYQRPNKLFSTFFKKEEKPKG